MHSVLHPQDQVGRLRVVGSHDDAAVFLMGQTAEELHDEPRVLSARVSCGLVRQKHRRAEAQAPDDG